MENSKPEQKIIQLALFCYKNKIEFIFQKEDEGNYVKYESEPIKKVTLNISDPEDPNFESVLDERIDELNQLFQ
jgi:hypothetical protein